MNNGGPEHATSPGPNRSNVTDPDGENPPDTLAVSETWPPTTTGADACVTTTTVDAGETTTDSAGSEHPVATGALFASPEYDATNEYVPAALVVNGPDT